MCSIFGFYNEGWDNEEEKQQLLTSTKNMARRAVTRGRDAFGVALFMDGKVHKVSRSFPRTELVANIESWICNELDSLWRDLPQIGDNVTLLGNLRAEPTTEWLSGTVNPNDIQPYSNYPDNTVWAVHNGTIANDELFIPAHAPTKVDSQAIPYAHALGILHTLIGSVAAVLYEPQSNTLTLTRNYRPLFYSRQGNPTSSLHFHSTDFALNSVSVYPNRSITLTVNPNNSINIKGSDRTTFDPYVTHYHKAVVILSGGLDSTTVAEIACKDNEEVLLAHFHYGARAQSKETKAVTNIHEHLAHKYPNKKIGLKFFDLSFLKQLGGNPLVDDTMEIAQGKTGIEFAKEWVPYRNGLMASMAIAYCDRWGYGNIYLGTNLEEAGAYPDNEEEFFELLEKAAAVGSKSHPVFKNPLALLMKHEIVALALKTEAPIHLSWSCYKGEDVPCGTCGPCLMRKTAFQMNGVQDMHVYADNEALVGL